VCRLRLCLCLRRRRALRIKSVNQHDSQPPDRNAALPSRELLVRQAKWLRDARARLLRRAAITRRRHIVELGAGWGIVTEELARRSSGKVTAVDCNPTVVAQAGQRPEQTDRSLANAAASSGSATSKHASINWLLARAEQVPLDTSCCDLVFAQYSFLWFADPRRAISEACRILQLGGAIAVIEPDYGGLIEYPPQIAVKSIWIDAIERAGGDPYVGRRLPGLLIEAGLSVDVQLLDRLKPPDPARFDFLAELPLTAAEQTAVQRARTAEEQAGTHALAHLPVLMIYAE
jgi:SAM-dependent methyltransferase